MKLTNEFTVAADTEAVWRQLLDMEGVAACLPGATIEPTDEPDTYSGSMRVKMGPMTVTYKGTAQLKEVDDEARRAVIDLRAREAKGQGTTTATITDHVQPHAGGTRVVAETDLQITGAQARFGQGVMVDVAGRVLAEFSRRLEQRITPPPGVSPDGAGRRGGARGGAGGRRPAAGGGARRRLGGVEDHRRALREGGARAGAARRAGPRPAARSPALSVHGSEAVESTGGARDGGAQAGGRRGRR
jgi:carbon monoxide dehydrogenase subunit G